GGVVEQRRESLDIGAFERAVARNRRDDQRVDAGVGQLGRYFVEIAARPLRPSAHGDLASTDVEADRYAIVGRQLAYKCRRLERGSADHDAGDADVEER